ncbi:MAG: hypothetical protein WBF75_20845, partial [Pseudonocardiaceae bacterium]
MSTLIGRGRPVRVVVVFDTAGFLGSLPLSGAAARTVHLNGHLHALGCPTTVLLCDLNPRSRATSNWPLPVRYLPYEALYERTEPLFTQVQDLAPAVLVMSSTQLVVRYGRALAEASGARLVYEMHDDEGAVAGIVNLVACLVAGRIPGLLAVRWEGLGLVGVEAPSY